MSVVRCLFDPVFWKGVTGRMSASPEGRAGVGPWMEDPSSDLGFGPELPRDFPPRHRRRDAVSATD